MLEVKEKILDVTHRNGPVFIYFHDGREIRYDDGNTKLEDIFGNEELFGDDDTIEVKLDFAWPRAGPVKIICEGDNGLVRVMHNEESVVTIKSNDAIPETVELKRSKAIVSIVILLISVVTVSLI